MALSWKIWKPQNQTFKIFMRKMVLSVKIWKTENQTIKTFKPKMAYHEGFERLRIKLLKLFKSKFYYSEWEASWDIQWEMHEDHLSKIPQVHGMILKSLSFWTFVSCCP